MTNPQNIHLHKMYLESVGSYKAYPSWCSEVIIANQPGCNSPRKHLDTAHLSAWFFDWQDQLAQLSLKTTGSRFSGGSVVWVFLGIAKWVVSQPKEVVFFVMVANTIKKCVPF